MGARELLRSLVYMAIDELLKREEQDEEGRRYGCLAGSWGNVSTNWHQSDSRATSEGGGRACAGAAGRSV